MSSQREVLGRSLAAELRGTKKWLVRVESIAPSMWVSDGGVEGGLGLSPLVHVCHEC